MRHHASKSVSSFRGILLRRNLGTRGRVLITRNVRPGVIIGSPRSKTRGLLCPQQRTSSARPCMSEKCPEAVIRERPSMINSGDVQTHANLIFNGNGEFYLRTRFAFRVLRTIKTSPPSVKFATCIIPSLSKSLDRFEDLPGTETC